MSRLTSNPVTSITPNERCNNTPQTSNPANQRHQSSGVEPSWRANHSTAASPAPCSPIIEDGFKLVSRPKVQFPQGKATHNRDPNPYAATTNRSAAAVGRASVYEAPHKRESHYKQSCLPVDKRDPALFDAELGKGKKIAKEAFRPGTIIRAVLHEPDLQGAAGASNVTKADKFRTDSVHGPIFTKTRKMIVLATFKDNYIAVPLYTHNGRGLEGKPNPEEFVSVQDHRLPGLFTPLSHHKPLVTKHLNAGIKPFHVKSVVYITYPVSRKYTLPVVQEGFLHEKSIEHLASLFSKYITPFLSP